ncbi:uncharacterized protein LOC143052478 [Mytilus galloprovincialis]|uniref:uncharacterized protein LOC143052478 n=1 Tax=Mytilus galloprovincialis TaxID=29158 RepID=UPI003F7CA990
MPWQEKCRLIKSDPVTCARYFDYRVQKFFKDILMDELVKPLGEVTDYFYRVEFQQRGSPHIHMVLWVKNAPDISNDQDERIEQFIDDHITRLKQPDLINLLAYQTHRHARTCRKKGKSICRFNFPQPPMSKTRILQPMSAGEREEASDCANIYGKITKKLDEYKSGSDISYEDFLIELKLKESEYIKAIRWSMTRPRVFLKRELSEIRINSYNPVMLKCWSANIDVQFILDAYSCAAYIVSYVSKGQRGMSNLMYRAVKECRENNFSIQQEIRCVSNKFLTHVEIGAQEAVYLVLQMPLRKSSRKVIFINTSPPQERLILLKSYSDLEDMSKSSTDVESDNWIKRYERRPKALDKWCLADFVSWFEISYQKEKLKRQVVTEIDLPETNDIENEDDNPHDPNEHELSEAIQSSTEYNMADGGILRKRQFQKVLRYVRYNEKNDPTNHYRELIMLFHHWRKEVNDIPTSLQEVYALYKHHENTIKETRNAYERNRKVLEIVEMNAENRDDNDESIDTQFMPECLHTDEQDMYEGQTLTERYGCFDPGKQLTYDVGADMGVTRKQIEDDDYMLNKIPESQYRQIVSTLNNEQKVFFLSYIALVQN